MKRISNFLPFILLLLSICIAFLLKELPYIVNNYPYLIGFDSGRYIYNLIHRTSTSINSIDIWTEPGLNTMLVSLNSVVQLPPAVIYKVIMPLVSSITFPIIVFLYTKKITKSNIAGAYSSLFIATSTIFLNSTFDSFYRQMYSTIIFMVFLYFLQLIFIENAFKFKHIILLAILGAGIIVSHRGITILYVGSLFILFVKLFIERKFRLLKYIVILGSISIMISSIYWLVILKDNLIVLKEAIINSTKKNSGGERIIKTLKRSDNQIQGYISSISTSFLPILGVILLTIKQKFNLLTLFTIFLIVYIYFKATFSNRFLFNLELFMVVAVGVVFHYMLKNFNRKILMILFSAIILLNLMDSINITYERKPYVIEETESTAWVKKNISLTNSIIFAPDALSTIFAQLGYTTAVNDFPIEIGSGKKDSATLAELFLTNGYKDVRLLKDVHNYKFIYIVFGDWNITNPLPRAKHTIDISMWDKSKYFERLYTGDPLIRRVYLYKNI